MVDPGEAGVECSERHLHIVALHPGSSLPEAGQGLLSPSRSLAQVTVP